MRVKRNSIKLTFVLIGCFIALAICARLTERALPTAAAVSQKPVIVIDAGHGGYALSGVAV